MIEASEETEQLFAEPVTGTMTKKPDGAPERRPVDQIIREAMERGDFDNLEGAGKPLDLSENAYENNEFSLAFKVLRDAGYLPPGLDTNKEIRFEEQKCKELIVSYEKFCEGAIEKIRSAWDAMSKILSPAAESNAAGIRNEMSEKPADILGQIDARLKGLEDAVADLKERRRKRSKAKRQLQEIRDSIADINRKYELLAREYESGLQRMNKKIERLNYETAFISYLPASLQRMHIRIDERLEQTNKLHHAVLEKVNSVMANPVP